MKKIVLLSCLALTLTATAHANIFLECTAKGRATSQMGGQMLPTSAKLSFDVQDDFNPLTNPVMTILGVKGYVKVGAFADSRLDADNAYIGYFDEPEMRSNPKYRPLKYKNMVQFQNLNAYKTEGVESGMWGQLLIDKGLGDGSQAKYVFQAGDHMGGTVHLTCRAQD